MDKKDIKRVVDRLRASLEKVGIRVNEVVLFGSFAKGTPHKDSDIDLVIISADFRKLDFFERARVLGRAHWEVPEYPMDLIGVTPEEWNESASLLLQFAKKDKVVKIE